MFMMGVIVSGSGARGWRTENGIKREETRIYERGEEKKKKKQINRRREGET